MPVRLIRRTHRLWATGLVLWCVELAGSQSAPPLALSAELRTHVAAERFQLVTSWRGLPLGVRDELQALVGGQMLDIPEPAAESRARDEKTSSNLVIRRLLAAGCSYEHCLVYYERRGAERAWRVVLLHWTPDATRVEWGAPAQAGLKSIEDLRGVLLKAGATGSAGPW